MSLPTISITPDTNDWTDEDSESFIKVANVPNLKMESRLDVPTALPEVSRANSKNLSYV